MHNVAIKPAIEHCGLNTMGGDERGPLVSSKARCARYATGGVDDADLAAQYDCSRHLDGWFSKLKKKPPSQLRDLELLQRRGSKQRLEFGHLFLRSFFHPRFGSGGKGFLQSLLSQRFFF